jgi:N-glycosylase/DNA lyase
MVASLCQTYGTLIGTLGGIAHYSFPPVERLAQIGVIEKLRELNFGYRAKFIHQAAEYLKKTYPKHEDIFHLRSLPYKEVHEILLNIPGPFLKPAIQTKLKSKSSKSIFFNDYRSWSKGFRLHLFNVIG